MNASTRFAASAAALALVAAPASAIVIDGFDDGDFALTVAGNAADNGFDEQRNIAATSAIGGSRTARLDLREGRGVVDARRLDDTAQASMNGNGVLAVSDSARAFSDFVLEYSNLGGVDLTEGGTQNALAFDYSFFQGFSRVEPVIQTGSGTARLPVFIQETENDRSVGGANELNAQVKILEFADFRGTADFSDVEKITIFFQSADSGLGGATDFELDSITTIPEPASAALAAAGLMLLAGRRRR